LWIAVSLDSSKMNVVGDGVGYGVANIVYMVFIKLTGSSNGKQRCEWKVLVGRKLFEVGGQVRHRCQTLFGGSST